jgi:signal transduction histidine kinase
MWKRFSLRVRLFFIVGALTLITLAGGSVMVWYTYETDVLLRKIVDWEVAALQTSKGLQTALLNQKGFVSYFFLDGDPGWLEKLGQFRQAFKEHLDKARKTAPTQAEKEILDGIESQYAEYIQQKDHVIALYKAGDRQAGADLHRQVRRLFFTILERCESYQAVHTQRIDLVKAEIHTQAQRLRFITLAAIGTAIFLGLLLAFVLVTQVLNPLRQLAPASNGGETDVTAADEVKAVRYRVDTLLKSVNEAKAELGRSQEHLLQSEKLALVGKLAAGTAHSIRNPLTSVKMRLFSLGRSLDLSGAQQDDFDVISEEIRHIDTIVQNFLEFSRPPKLKMQTVSLSDVVDTVLRLLHHRLQSYGVEVTLHRPKRLPEITADPEQIKEVLVNLLINACEVTGQKGRIDISEEEKDVPPLGRAVVIRVADNGPGIPGEIQTKVFEPFFTTKEEGTGLGLSIAMRIVEEHNGRLALQSEPGQGAVFVMAFPAGGIHWVESSSSTTTRS